jgi:coenzyme F420-dependent glucose-6-phosphate dehydrogenase
MLALGYSISSEEHPANELVKQAKMAEDAGFSFAMISDHFHPWTHKQGNSPFVWSVLGAIAHATERIPIGTAVTCPTVRIHPGIIAQAAATVASMMPGRFMLGVGSGENLNEHIFGSRWPSSGTRIEMLAEAIEVIRKLWRGGWQNHHGRYYTVENARIFSLPKQLPPIFVASACKRSAQLAGRMAQGIISTKPNPSTVEVFEQAGGKSKPRFGQIAVCWARDEAQARRQALEIWPNAAIGGQASFELPLPRHFEELAKGVTEDDVASGIVCGPDPQKHLAAIREFAQAGFDHVFVHQVGPDQKGFVDFYRSEILPELRAMQSDGRDMHERAQTEAY